MADILLVGLGVSHVGPVDRVGGRGGHGGVPLGLGALEGKLVGEVFAACVEAFLM